MKKLFEVWVKMTGEGYADRKFIVSAKSNYEAEKLAIKEYTRLFLKANATRINR